MGYFKFRLSAAHLILFIAFFFLSLQIPDDPDFGINLGVGKYILQKHQFPRTDIFSFSLPNHPYVYHSWLGQVVMTVVYQGSKSLGEWLKLGNLGLLGLAMGWSAMAAVGVFWLYGMSVDYSVRQRLDGQRFSKEAILDQHFWITLVFLVLTALVFSSIGVRPQMFSFLFLLAEVWILLNWHRSKKEFWKQGGIWLLIPLLGLWSNMHLGFIIGLVIAGGWLAALWVEKPDFKTLKFGLVFILFAFGATLVNPYGFGLYQQAWAIATNPFNTRTNLEWVPLVARGTPHWLFTGIVILLLVIALRGKKVDWPLAFLSLFLFWGALRSTRVILPFLVVFLPFIAPTLGAMPSPFAAWKQPEEQQKSAKLGLFKTSGIFSKFYLFLLVFLIPLAVLARGVTNLGILLSVVGNQQVLAARQNYPWGAVQYMKSHDVSERLLNYFNWGGYLVWQMPQRKVFESGIMDTFRVDGRLFLTDYFNMVNAAPDWEKLMNTYSIKAVLLPPEAPIIQVLSQQPDWRVVYQDQASILMVR